jgi:hypothetical protein
MTIPGYKAIAARLARLAGDVSVVVVTDADFKSLYTFKKGFNAAAIYDPNSDQIVVPNSLFYESPEWVAHVLLHEGAHAAYHYALKTDKVFRGSVEAIMERMASQYTPAMRRALGINYAFTNIDEFLSEALSNPRLQDAMAMTAVTPRMAKDMGFVPGLVSTVWHAFVRAARRAAMIDAKDVSALEAILHAVGRAESSAQRGRAIAREVAAVWSEDLPSDVVLASRTDMATQEVQAMLVSKLQAASTTASPKRLRNAMFKVMAGDQLARYASKYFPDNMAQKAIDVVERMRKRGQDLVAQAGVISNLHKAQVKYAGTETWGAFTNLMADSSTFGIHPDVPLKDPKNGHIKKSDRWLQARQAHAVLSPEWHKLPQDLKQLWRDTAKFPETRQNQMGLLKLELIVETALGRKDKQLTQRIFNGTATEADRDLFKTSAAMRAIANATEAKKLDGVYFPKMRHGNFAVLGEYQLPAKYKKFAKTGADGVVSYQFEDKKDAEAFVKDMLARGIHTPTSVYTIDATTNAMLYTYTDPTTGQTIKNPDGSDKQFRFAKGDTGTKTIIKASPQVKMLKLYDTEAEALADRALLAAEGDYGATLSGVEQKKQLQHGDARITSRNMVAAMNSMQQGAAWKKMSDTQKQLVQQTILEMSMNSLSATAPLHRARPRRNILGASTDITRDMAEYVAVTSRVVASLELRPELDDALNALDKHNEAVRYTDTATSLPRTQVLEALHYHVEYRTGGEPNVPNRVTNALLTLSMLYHLVSPAYHFINGLQTPMVATPVMAGRHGVARTTLELIKAYKAVGAVNILKTGAKDTKKAFTDYLEGTTDYVVDMNKRLTKEKDGAELMAVIKYVSDRGGMDKDSGMEVSDLVGNATGVERVLHRTDHIVRQFGIAMETLNRAPTIVAAYRMERAKGASIEQATRYAQDRVLETQGNFSATNRAVAFRHPLMRLPLQFKSYAQLQYALLAKLSYNTFKGATPEIKREAAKSLTMLLISHAAMAGVLGLPTEPIKISFMVLGMFLPMPSWEEVEEDITHFAQQFLGDDLGDAITHGLPRLVKMDLHGRVGLNSLGLFGEPRQEKTENWQAWMWRTVTGSALGTVTSNVEGVIDITNGDFAAGVPKLLPFKALRDSVKAYQLATEGKTNKRGESTMEPLGLADAAIQAFGIKPASVARQQESVGAYYSKSNARKEARQTLLDAFKNASPSERAKVRRDIMRYNAGVPANARITMKSLSNMLKRAKTDNKKGYLKKGVYSGAVNQDLAEEYLGD